MDTPPEYENRLARVEAALAALSSTVTSLVEEWKNERADMRAAIHDLRSGGETKWSVIVAWVGVVFVLGGMAATLIGREAAHLEQRTDLLVQQNKMRLDMIRQDHDETVKNSERWRLMESGVLRPPALWELIEERTKLGEP